MKKVFFLTGKSISEQEIRKILYRLIQEGYTYFICFAKNRTDILILKTLKLLKQEGKRISVELVCSDKNMNLPQHIQEDLYRGCDDFCFIDNFSKDQKIQEYYLIKRANLASEL
jgi:hypothetical protein